MGADGRVFVEVRHQIGLLVLGVEEEDRKDQGCTDRVGGGPTCRTAAQGDGGLGGGG